MEQLQEENKRLKRKIQELTIESKICRLYATDQMSADYNPHVFSFTNEWKFEFKVFLSLEYSYPIYRYICQIKDEEKTEYFLKLCSKNTVARYFNFDDEDLITYNAYLYNFELSPLPAEFERSLRLSPVFIIKASDAAPSYYTEIKNELDNAIRDGCVQYWDINIFSIIQEYLNLPYHLKNYHR